MSVTIDKRPSGKYRAQVRVSGYPVQSRSFPRRAQARSWGEQQERDLLDQAVDPTSLSRRRTLNQAIDLYCEEALPQKKSVKSITNRLNFWRKKCGDVRLVDLSPQTLTKQIDALTCSGPTKNRYLTDLSGCLTFISKTPYCWISNNPARRVSRLPDSKRRERVITSAEWDRLLAAANQMAESGNQNDVQLPLFLRVLYASGMRRGEAMKLLWADLEHDTGLVTVRDPKNGVDRRAYIGTDIVADIAALPRRPDDVYVFVGRWPDKPTSFDIGFRAARDLADIGLNDKGEKLDMHCLRHSVATEAGKAGANIVELQALTGHKSLKSLQQYLHADDTALLAALRKRGAK